MLAVSREQKEAPAEEAARNVDAQSSAESVRPGEPMRVEPAVPELRRLLRRGRGGRRGRELLRVWEVQPDA